jgi:OOP family OmpA-OmpF porin
MRLIYAFVASALLASAPAFAADDSGFYVGAGVGDFGVEIGAFDDSDIGFKVFGGYQFMKYLGAELEYIDGGTAEDFGLKVDVSGFNLSAMGILPVGEKFNVFAKLGMIFWDADLSGAARGSDSGEDFSWGVGAGYDFTDQFGARLEYQGFEIEDADGDMISLSASWKF